MPASTNGEPVGAITAATRSAVGGLMALQSTNTGLALLAVSAGANRCASATASPGGRIDRMKSAAAISSSLAAVRPAALARFDGLGAAAGERGQNLEAVGDQASADGGAHHAGGDDCNDWVHDNDLHHGSGIGRILL